MHSLGKGHFLLHKSFDLWMLHKLYDLIRHSQSDEKKTFPLLHQVASRHADPLGLFFIYLNQLFGAKSCTVGDLFAGLYKD